MARKPAAKKLEDTYTYIVVNESTGEILNTHPLCNSEAHELAKEECCNGDTLTIHTLGRVGSYSTPVEPTWTPAEWTPKK